MKKDPVAVRELTLLPPSPDRCQECGAEHGPQEPHNPESVYYQVAFQRRHGRWPTWQDAVAHLAPDLQAEILAIVAEAQARQDRGE